MSKTNMLKATTVGIALMLSGVASGQDWIEAQQLTASDPGEGDFLGFEVAFDGDTILAGAGTDDLTGIDEGSAYVFVRDGDGWLEQAKLVSSRPADENRFGWSVALDGDRAVVSEFQGDGAAVDSGCVYVFDRSGDVWSESARLFDPGGATDEQFGFDVAIDGDTIAIGALRAGDGGVVYVYDFDGAAWQLSQVVVPRDGDPAVAFGVSVALSGDRLLVGDESADDGTAYVFERSADRFEQVARLQPGTPEPSRSFGSYVAIDGDIALVGAIRASVGSPLRGRAFAFRREAGGWVRDFEFPTFLGDRSETFGSVGIEGNLAVIGAQNYNAELPSAGRAYVFERLDSGWVLRDLLVPNTPVAGALFGNSVSVSGGSIAIASAADDAPLDRSGSVYTFERNPCPADIDGDGALSVFDFLAFQNAFDAMEPVADFDRDGEFTLFDFLAFQTAFDAGCP